MLLWRLWGADLRSYSRGLGFPVAQPTGFLGRGK